MMHCSPRQVLGAKYKHLSDTIVIKAGVELMARCQKVCVKVTDRWSISACVVPEGLLMASHAFMNKI